jgi:hypothetical protein
VNASHQCLSGPPASTTVSVPSSLTSAVDQSTSRIPMIETIVPRARRLRDALRTRRVGQMLAGSPGQHDDAANPRAGRTESSHARPTTTDPALDACSGATRAVVSASESQTPALGEEGARRVRLDSRPLALGDAAALALSPPHPATRPERDRWGPRAVSWATASTRGRRRLAVRVPRRVATTGRPAPSNRDARVGSGNISGEHCLLMPVALQQRLFADGRCWARTSDLLLVRQAL